MTNISLNTLLNRITPKTGLPFPSGGRAGEGDKVASGFKEQADVALKNQYDSFFTPIVQVTDEKLGRYEFMPVIINDGIRDYHIPNAMVMISGEKEIIETDVVDRGTVFEKVFERPYDISIVMTIQSTDNAWPAEKYKEMAELYHGMSVGDYKVKVTKGNNIISRDLVTLKSALTNPYLADKDNFIITKISVLDNEYSENTEMIQIDGRSNVEFELIIK